MPERDELKKMITEFIKELTKKRVEPEQINLLREMINAYRAFGGY